MDDQQDVEETPNSGTVTIGGAWRILLIRSGFRHGGTQSLLVNLLVIAAFGILVPWKRGFDFFDPFVMFAYSTIAVLFAASAITDLIASGSAGEPLFAAIFASSLHGWSVLALIDLCGITTVNMVYGARHFLHPNYSFVASTLLFALAGSLLLAAFGAMLSVVFSPPTARTAIRFLFVVALAAAYFGSNYLPQTWQIAVRRQMTTGGLTRAGLIGSAIAAILATGLLFALRKPSRTHAATV